MEVLFSFWPWYVAGLVIAVVLVLITFYGKKLAYRLIWKPRAASWEPGKSAIILKPIGKPKNGIWFLFWALCSVVLSANNF